MALTEEGARVMLRASIGYLLVIWGLDKVVNPAHGLAVPPSRLPACGGRSSIRGAGTSGDGKAVRSLETRRSLDR